MKRVFSMLLAFNNQDSFGGLPASCIVQVFVSKWNKHVLLFRSLDIYFSFILLTTVFKINW